MLILLHVCCNVLGKKKSTRKDDSSSDEFDSSSESELEEEEKREVPLWPPPKRMASLNAQVWIAIINEGFHTWTRPGLDLN